LNAGAELSERQDPQLPVLVFARRIVMTRLAARGLSSRTIEAIRAVPRAPFLPLSLWRLSHADLDLWRFNLGPSIYAAAELFDAAAPGRDEHCVEVGTGCGWFSAVLATAAATVATFDLMPGGSGHQRLSEYGVRVLGAEAVATWPIAISPFASADVVVISFAPPLIPRALLARLRVGARVVAAAGSPPQEIVVYTRAGSVVSGRRVGRCVTLGSHPDLAGFLDRIAMPEDGRR
jgi:protein-L-isoaspartate(D-aspartate) O-methyltransferase